MDKKNKKNALLKSAFDLFTKTDIHSVSVQDIVKQAGVAKGTFYLYFKDKYQARDVLIQNEAMRLFNNAHLELEKNDIQDFEDAVVYIINQVLLQLEPKTPSAIPHTSLTLTCLCRPSRKC